MVGHSESYQVGYGICAVAFLVAAALSPFSRLEGSRKWLLMGACAASAAWSAIAMLSVLFAVDLVLPFNVLEVFRDLAWIVLLISMLGFQYRPSLKREMVWPLTMVAITGCIVWLLILGAKPDWDVSDLGELTVSTYPKLLLSIFALVLIENVYRNCDVDARWGIKSLCLALLLIFAFDFIFYADVLFSGKPDTRFVEGRGFVESLAVPLLLLSLRRSRNWRGEISISRDVIFHSAVLLGSGAYLLTMASLGTLLHLTGGCRRYSPISTIQRLFPR